MDQVGLKFELEPDRNNGSSLSLHHDKFINKIREQS